MAMFTAYFDASGHSGSPGAMFVSGFVATMDKWLRFEEAWRDLLAEYEIENPFHMTDFVAGYGQYACWKDDKERRRSFLREAIQIIKRYTNKDFSHGVRVSDLKRLRREFAIPTGYAAGLFETPYSFCAMGAYAKVVEWVRRYVKRHPGAGQGQIELVYDHGDRGRGHFLNIMQNEFRILPIARTAADALPIQAADILAWEHARHVNAQARVSALGDRKSLVELARHLPGSREWAFSGYEALVRLCEEKGFERRPN